MTQQSHVYVMPEYVEDVGGGIRVPATRGPSYNAHRTLVEKYLPQLPPDMVDEHNRLVSDEHREARRIRDWSVKFLTALADGDELPAMQMGRTVAVDTSTDKGVEDLTSLPRALYAVVKAGWRGTTSLEARRHDEKGGGISGSLSKLHRAGVIECLEQTR